MQQQQINPDIIILGSALCATIGAAIGAGYYIVRDIQNTKNRIDSDIRNLTIQTQVLKARLQALAAARALAQAQAQAQAQSGAEDTRPAIPEEEQGSIR